MRRCEAPESPPTVATRAVSPGRSDTRVRGISATERKNRYRVGELSAKGETGSTNIEEIPVLPVDDSDAAAFIETQIAQPMRFIPCTFHPQYRRPTAALAIGERTSSAM
jgi:hypothetical protein